MRSASCVPRLANTASDRGGNGTRKLRTGLAIGLAERLPHLRADVRCWNCGGAGRLFDGRGRGGIRARVHQYTKRKVARACMAPRCVAFGTTTGSDRLSRGSANANSPTWLEPTPPFAGSFSPGKPPAPGCRGDDMPRSPGTQTQAAPSPKSRAQEPKGLWSARG